MSKIVVTVGGSVRPLDISNPVQDQQLAAMLLERADVIEAGVDNGSERAHAEAASELVASMRRSAYLLLQWSGWVDDSPALFGFMALVDALKTKP